VLVAGGLLGLAAPRTARGVLTIACAILGVGYLAYAVSVGGDFMGLHRFIMPVFVATAILVTLGLEIMHRALGSRGRAAGVLAIVIAVDVIAAFAYFQVRLTQFSINPKHTAPDGGIDTPAFLIVYTEDRAAIGRAMAPCFHPDDFSIVGGAGAQPYYGRMRAIDVFGLVSEKIAHTEPRVRARAGHTKFGNDQLLASYDPTFVFSCYQIHPSEQQPPLPCAPFWKNRGYEEVTIRVPAMREKGTYYTFLAKQSRAFTCPNRVH
jgi:arabinofuranosyltransferase